MSYNGVIGLVNVFVKYLLPKKIVCIDLREESHNWLLWCKDKAISEVYWIESDYDCYLALEKRISTLGLEVNLVAKTISNITGDASYYQTSLNQENGLISPDKLQSVWKNISEKKVEQRQAVAFKDAIDFTVKNQWLLIDSLNGITLLQDESLDLKKFDLIVVRVIFDKNRTHIQTLTSKLEKDGFLLLDQCATSYPELVRVVFIRNYPMKNVQLTKDCEKLNVHYENVLEDKNTLSAQNLDLQNIQAELVSKVEHLDRLRSETQEALMNSLNTKEQQIEDLKKQYDQLLLQHEQLLDKNSTIKDLSTMISSLDQNMSKAMTTVQQSSISILDCVNSQKQSLDKVNTFNKKQAITQSFISKTHVNTISQIENYIALNNYFNTGKKLSNYHGWPISPDIALFIVDRMSEVNYDAVIEFGSGTSTELLAKIADRKKQSNQKVPKILSFDHLTEYHQKTLSLLLQNGLDSYVELEHAPLIPISFGEEDYQYYDCAVYLQRFLARLPEKAKILVLVDGPPGATCQHARYPALPLILSSVEREASLDLLLDDASRQEEKEVAAKWIKLLGKYNYSYDKSVPRVSEKGLILLSIQKIRDLNNAVFK